MRTRRDFGWLLVGSSRWQIIRGCSVFRLPDLPPPPIRCSPCCRSSARAGYSAVVTVKAALAALAALFFSRFTLAQRFC